MTAIKESSTRDVNKQWHKVRAQVTYIMNKIVVPPPFVTYTCYGGVGCEEYGEGLDALSLAKTF